MSNNVNALILCDAHRVGPEFGKASPWALFFLLIILAALILILVSMSKHLKKMQRYFTQIQSPASQAPIVQNNEIELDERSLEGKEIASCQYDALPPTAETE